MKKVESVSGYQRRAHPSLSLSESDVLIREGKGGKQAKRKTLERLPKWEKYHKQIHG